MHIRLYSHAIVLSESVSRKSQNLKRKPVTGFKIDLLIAVDRKVRILVSVLVPELAVILCLRVIVSCLRNRR